MQRKVDETMQAGEINHGTIFVGTLSKRYKGSAWTNMVKGVCGEACRARFCFYSHTHTRTRTQRDGISLPRPRRQPCPWSRVSAKRRGLTAVCLPQHTASRVGHRSLRGPPSAPLSFAGIMTETSRPPQVTAWKPCTVGDGTPRRSKLTPSNPEQRERHCPCLISSLFQPERNS